MTEAPGERTTAADGASTVRGGSAIAFAIGVMNVSTYVFTIIAARLLGPGEFGAFASVMNVLLVASVFGLAMQATAARRVAREPEQASTVEAAILAVGRRSALLLGLGFVVLSPLVDRVLRLNDLAVALGLAVAIVPVTLTGAQAGVLQGERRWVPLAGVYLAAGLPRLVLGGALIWWQPTPLVAMASVAVTSYAPILVGAAALRGIRAGAEGAVPSTEHSARSLTMETIDNSQALLAFLMLSSLDIVIARNALDHHSAGLYAGGLIMTKAVLFLPQFVVVLAFPAMGADHTRRGALVGGLALVAATGGAVVLGAWALSGLALGFVGGTEYKAIEGMLWQFAALGTVLAMIQLLVYGVLATRARRLVLLLWGGLLALVGLGLAAGSVQDLLVRVLAIDGVLLAFLIAVLLGRIGGLSAQPRASSAPSPPTPPDPR